MRLATSFTTLALILRAIATPVPTGDASHVLHAKDLAALFSYCFTLWNPDDIFRCGGRCNAVVASYTKAESRPWSDKIYQRATVVNKVNKNYCDLIMERGEEIRKQAEINGMCLEFRLHTSVLHLFSI